MKEQTAVEWLTSKLEERWMGLTPSWVCDILSQAKEMEANQHHELIEKSYKAGSDDTINLMEKIVREKLEGM